MNESKKSVANFKFAKENDSREESAQKSKSVSGYPKSPSNLLVPEVPFVQSRSSPDNPKRNYDAFLETHSPVKKSTFQDNPKIQKFCSTLKLRIPSQMTLAPHYTYFFPENIRQDNSDRFIKQLYEINSSNAL